MEEYKGTVLLPQLVLIFPITKQETNPGPAEANGKSLDLAPQIYFSHHLLLPAFQKMGIPRQFYNHVWFTLQHQILASVLFSVLCLLSFRYLTALQLSLLFTLFFVTWHTAIISCITLSTRLTEWDRRGTWPVQVKYKLPLINRSNGKWTLKDSLHQAC